MAKTKNQIKLPKARQLPSGNWFVQLRLNGQSIPITEATEQEAIAKAMAIKDGIIEYQKTPLSDQTLTQAIDLWFSENEDRLSPSTIRGYITCQKNGFKTLMHMKCGKITDKAIASAINQECRKYSAKTLENRWRFIAQVLEWSTGKRYSPKLHQTGNA